DKQMLAYIRQSEDADAFLIVLNLSHRPCYFTPSTIRFGGVIEIDTFPEQEKSVVADSIPLSGDEGMVIRLESWAFQTSSIPGSLSAATTPVRPS
ncbi:MAG: hypothetical protein Q8938_15115, partial [Bacteroidota bacterium]|nr:hypothetical protein [Bacteroidota bacterium]